MNEPTGFPQGIGSMMPMLPDPQNPRLAELSQRIFVDAGALRAALPDEAMRQSVAALVREKNSYYSNQGNGAMVNFPFYSNSGIGNPRAHWGIRGNGDRWECDDTGSTASASHSLFRVWAR